MYKYDHRFGHPGVAASDRVRQIEVPSQARALSWLSRIDYEDAFLVDLGSTSERTAEQWARALFEDAPAVVRHALRVGWSAIGLKLGVRPSARLVLGWTLRRGTPEVVLLGAESRTGMPAELLVSREGDDLLFCTFVQHDNQLARAVWAGVELVHVPVVRGILEHASRQHRP